MKCCICNGIEFSEGKVLWPELINDWQLSDSEVKYIDQQQGLKCTSCGSNVRTIALAKAIKSYFQDDDDFETVSKSEKYSHLSILELNEAGNLTKFLKNFKGYKFGSYPEVDMHNLPYEDNSFDLVVHSDTLEHVENPVHALKECHRVLKTGGALSITVPIIVGRMTRNRNGLKKSYHGSYALQPEDFIVHTEYGADAWTQLIKAGFTEVTIHTLLYPAGISLVGRKA